MYEFVTVMTSSPASDAGVPISGSISSLPDNSLSKGTLSPISEFAEFTAVFSGACVTCIVSSNVSPVFASLLPVTTPEYRSFPSAIHSVSGISFRFRLSVPADEKTASLLSAASDVSPYDSGSSEAMRSTPGVAANKDTILPNTRIFLHGFRLISSSSPPQ